MDNSESPQLWEYLELRSTPITTISCTNMSTNSLLSMLLITSWPAVQKFRNRARQQTDESLSSSAPAKKQADNLTGLGFTLTKNSTRDTLLQTFLMDATREQWLWLQTVKKMTWDAASWQAQAHGLFLAAERLHIKGVVAYALVKASMTLKGFQVPQHLSVQVICAKKTRDHERAQEKMKR